MISKTGLVLAGGGAKGAYQASAVKYLAEIDFKPQLIAGTSIGALILKFQDFNCQNQYLQDVSLHLKYKLLRSLI